MLSAAKTVPKALQSRSKQHDNFSLEIILVISLRDLRVAQPEKPHAKKLKSRVAAFLLSLQIFLSFVVPVQPFLGMV